MNIEAVREYCLAKAGTSEGFPFGNDTLVFKVMGKMFCLLALETGNRINLKCDPDWVPELREQHPEDILPGYHMNKATWNTVILNGRLGDSFLQELIDHSYQEVVKTLAKKVQKELQSLDEG
ncbi:MAG: MmcQ/YjbR family DNA-binding protein [Bacteroidota bacterium]